MRTETRAAADGGGLSVSRLVLAVLLALLGGSLIVGGVDFMGTIWGWGYRDNADAVYIGWGGFLITLGLALVALGVLAFRRRRGGSLQTVTLGAIVAVAAFALVFGYLTQ